MIAPWYVMAYTKLDRIAWRHGYALALHGSMARDLDLVAIPWTEDADNPEKLIDSIRRFVVLKTNVDLKIAPPVKRPHGRLSYIIPIGYDSHHYIDLSVMPISKQIDDEMCICECCNGSGKVPGEWYGEEGETTCPDCDGKGNEKDFYGTRKSV